MFLSWSLQTVRCWNGAAQSELRQEMENQKSTILSLLSNFDVAFICPPGEQRIEVE
jgi:hypothetical protein